METQSLSETSSQRRPAAKTIRLLFLALLAALPLLPTALALAMDEGLARNTELGDRDLVADSQRKQKNKENTYDALEEDDDQAPSGSSRAGRTLLPNELLLGLGLDYFNSFGLQARYARRVFGEAYVEGGLGVVFYGAQNGQGGVMGFEPTIVGRWDFWAAKRYAFFGELGLGYNAVTSGAQSFVRGGGLRPVVGVGATLDLSSAWAARADLSYPFVGLSLIRRF